MYGLQRMPTATWRSESPIQRLLSTTRDNPSLLSFNTYVTIGLHFDVELKQNSECTAFNVSFEFRELR